MVVPPSATSRTSEPTPLRRRTPLWHRYPHPTRRSRSANWIAMMSTPSWSCTRRSTSGTAITGSSVTNHEISPGWPTACRRTIRRTAPSAHSCGTAGRNGELRRPSEQPNRRNGPGRGTRRPSTRDRHPAAPRVGSAGPRPRNPTARRRRSAVERQDDATAHRFRPAVRDGSPRRRRTHRHSPLT